MDEFSSESFQTETGEAATEKPNTSEAQDTKQSEEETTKGNEEKDNLEKDSNEANNDDEFEQISDGTFELDENSQATSAGGVGNNEENTSENTKPTDEIASAQEPSVEVEMEEHIAEDAEASHEAGGDAGADFENVDANVSTNSIGAANEADALGEEDMTLPTEKENAQNDDDDDNAQDASGMDVDASTDAAADDGGGGNEDENNDESMGNIMQDTENTNEDVEMDSPDDASKEPEELMDDEEEEEEEEGNPSDSVAKEIEEEDETTTAEAEIKDKANETENAAKADSTVDAADKAVLDNEHDAHNVTAGDETDKNVEIIGDVDNDVDMEKDANIDVKAVEEANKDDEPVEEADKDGEPSEDAEKEDELSKDAEKEDEPSKDAEKEDEPSKDADKDSVPVEEANKAGVPVEEADKDGEPVEEADKDGEPVEETDKDSEPTEDAEKEAEPLEDVDKDNEPEDQSVENVQEPEESDICLIPDDTENEMTEAEKEQAILARENAEKEADEAEAEAEKEKEKEKEKSIETEKSSETSIASEIVDAVADVAAIVADDAQATDAGAESAAAGNSEETTPNAETIEAPDPDEPLLEELHSSSIEPGAQAKTIISWIVSTFKTCYQCKTEKHCGFRFRNTENTAPDAPATYDYLCEQSCCDALIAVQPGKFFVRRKKYLVEEVNESSEESNQDCLQCKDAKPCKYFFKQDEEAFYICNDDCFNLLNAEEPDKFKLKRHSIRVRNIGAALTLTSSSDGNSPIKKNDTRVVARTAIEAENARIERVASFVRRCVECNNEVIIGDKNLLWETLDFCNEICLGKYQRKIGAACRTCSGDVPHQALGKYCVRFGFDIRQFCCALCLNEFKKGLKTCSCCQKDISGVGEGFLAPVGDKEQFKDFCTQTCMRRYDAMCNPKKKLRNDICAVCNNDKPVRVEILLDDKEHLFCSNPCFSAFKFVSNIIADQCGMCSKYFERKASEAFTIYTDRRPKVFCTRICLNVFIINNRRIVSCQWCKVKKYNFDMIYKQHESQEILMCSLNCLTLYGVSINAFSRTVAKCDNCNNTATPQYHLTMSDASMRNFCTYQCVMQFQSQFARAPLTLETEPANTQHQQQQQTNSQKNAAPFPTRLPKRVKLKSNQQQQPQQHQAQKVVTKVVAKKVINAKQANQKQASTSLPVISTVSSLASGETMIGNVTVRRSRVRPGRKIDSPPPLPPPPAPSASSAQLQASSRGRPRKHVDYSRSPSPPAPSIPLSRRSTSAATYTSPAQAPPPPPQIKIQAETKIVAVPPFPPTVRNVQTTCKPQTVTVGFQCEPKTAVKEVQTGKDYSNKVLIPVPVPIYVPQPMYMYSAPFPIPVPIPLPIPVPIFIPTTRNSANGIMKEIKKIQDKMPADPFEAELLMMAEMVAEEKNVSDSDSDDEIKPDPSIVQLGFQNNEPEVTNNSYSEDVLQIALKMASDYETPQHQNTVDLESSMTANAIVNQPTNMHDMHMNSAHHMQQAHHIAEPVRPGRGRKRGSILSPGSPRNSRSPVKRPRLQEIEPVTTPEPVQPTEKPDANLCLKYTFGVNAWKQWVMTKNADLEKSTMRRRLFKTELLQMTADELNYSLCLFVKEVRKPNGTEYAPDTIYYLVLGIQQYLYENGRIDNIFTDPYYERFTDCLDEVARKFSVLYNDSQYIVTRVEEEHLWECKQLGAHSPHVLLSTLMFFNTKHFNLTSVEEHMQLSFSHIMKHWKRSAQNAKTPGARNVLLRFYPPQAGLDANPRKKKVYEQQENEENPLRCPVRLYEFYLSKCPESVKTRNDVFYLQPERSCVPDSPVWYSTQALSQDALEKMLHRVKMVKEINIALLTS